MKSNRSFFIVLISMLVSVSAVSRELPDFTGLIEKASPAVVKITTVSTVSNVGQRSPFGNQQDVPDFLRRYFDQEQVPEREARGLGSGFFISDDGYVLTNNHVVDGADEITVRTIDRREFEAKVIGTDPRSDLALLKVDGKKLPYLKFSDSSRLKAGEWVVAIGSPFGMDFSASQGIVSAIGRSIQDGSSGNYVPFIQTDVAINPGNSGGPLFNLDGEVVGINSQIFTRSGGYMGLSFAIPSDTAVGVVEQLRNKGRVDRGYLGVGIEDVSKEQAAALGLKKARGALVMSLLPDGPAGKSGIKPLDVIIQFNGIDIIESTDLPLAVGNTVPGTKVPVVIMRERKERKIEIEVGTLPGSRELAGGPAPTPQAVSPGDRLGLVVEGLGDIPEELQVSGGVLVSKVAPDSAAAKAGLVLGDIIVQINFNDITDVSSYEKLVAELPAGEALPIRFFRNGRPMFNPITIEE
ncbi:DegQ family serine endoprotease [Aurantivibrio infirmus]